MERGVSRAADAAEDDLEKVGKSMGEALADGMGDELGRHGKDLADAVEKSTAGRVIETQWGWRDPGSGRFVSRVGRDLEDEIEEVFERVGRRGDEFFGRIGEGFGDAIGAGFNISGKSPLISLMIPLVGVIIGLILAAVQAAHALIGVLATAPSLIAAIIAQAGVLYLAFKGVGGAITAAFAAKNSKELKAALKGLTPAAQGFVRELLPLRPLFRDLRNIAQESFFRQIGGSITSMIKTLGPILRLGVGPLATQLGKFFDSMGTFFSSKQFGAFVLRVFPATIRFLEKFGPGFVTFLEGLIAMSNAALPLLNTFGSILAGTFAMIGYWLQRAAENPRFGNWLKDMEETLISLQGLFFGLIDFARAFMQSLNEAGGAEIIDALTEALSRLTFILDSRAGQAAMEGLVIAVIFLTQAFVGLILTVLLAISVFTLFFQGLAELGRLVVEWFRQQDNNFSRWGSRTVAVFTGLPKRITAAVAGFGTLLYRSGASLIEGLIAGIKSKFGPLTDTARSIANIITSFLPGSPAEQGPLSGSGYSLLRGQAMIKDFARGMKMELPALRNTSLSAANNIVFGPNSIALSLNGASATPEQGRRMGMAVGDGISNKLAARNTRLAVRTL
jgi:hypothetical protein